MVFLAEETRYLVSYPDNELRPSESALPREGPGGIVS